MRPAVRRAGLALLLAGAACSDPTSQPPSEPAVGPTELVRAIARSMQQADIRREILGAMRASLVTQHKLVLQDYLADAAGQRLAVAMASVLGAAPGSLQEALRRTPRLDFYVPSSEDRMHWTGGAELVVAMTKIPGAKDAVFTVDGREVSRDLSPLSGRVVFLLHPEEPKSKRIGAQRPVPGPVIQDADDGEVGATIITDSAGVTTEVEVADAGPPDQPTCNPCPTCPPPPPPPPPPVDTTFVTSITLRDVCDNWLLAMCADNDNEIEITAEYFKQGVGRLATKTVRFTSMKNNRTNVLNRVLINARVRQNTTDYIQTTLKETDTFGDDQLGSARITPASNGVSLAVGSGGHVSVVYRWTPKF